MNFLQKALIKKAIAAQAKDLPEDMHNLLLRLVDENPELLMTIGNDIAAAVQSGKDQMTAAREVMEIHREALQQFIQKK